MGPVAKVNLLIHWKKLPNDMTPYFLPIINEPRTLIRCSCVGGLYP
jgi:hypothetical protein